MKVSDLLNYCYSQNYENLYILECGANREGEETKDLNSVNKFYIECNPSDFDALSTRHKNSFNFALHNQIGKVKFTVSSHPGNSSLNYSADHLNELQNVWKSSFCEIEVDAITYKYFIENVIKHNIDVLVLDVEGNETNILNDMKNLNKSQLPTFFIIECGYDWEKRLELLYELGYEVDFYGFNNCYLTLKNSNVIKNHENIKKTNSVNREFIWQGKLIYKNNL